MARNESRRSEASRRLDQPRELRRGIRPTVDPDAIGKVSERVARFLGTWRFIGYMSVFIAAWLIWNVVAPAGLTWDPRSKNFTLMTLILSLQASYAAPLILLAQNRQADRDRAQYEGDRATSIRQVADTEYLTREVAALRIAIGEVATRDFLRGELARLTDELRAESKAEAE